MANPANFYHSPWWSLWGAEGLLRLYIFGFNDLIVILSDMNPASRPNVRHPRHRDQCSQNKGVGNSGLEVYT